MGRFLALALCLSGCCRSSEPESWVDDDGTVMIQFALDWLSLLDEGLDEGPLPAWDDQPLSESFDSSWPAP